MTLLLPTEVGVFGLADAGNLRVGVVGHVVPRSAARLAAVVDPRT
jgi:hypothetical protein